METGKGAMDQYNLRAVPVVYGDPTRQVANIIRNNSENALNYAPKIACYVRELNYDRERMQNPYHIEKQHLRERGIDADGNYTNEMGAGYTVEKVMPSPFRLEVSADIWTHQTQIKNYRSWNRYYICSTQTLRYRRQTTTLIGLV